MADDYISKIISRVNKPKYTSLKSPVVDPDTPYPGKFTSTPYQSVAPSDHPGYVGGVSSGLDLFGPKKFAGMGALFTKGYKAIKAMKAGKFTGGQVISYNKGGTIQHD
jgi:hypothetical protein